MKFNSKFALPCALLITATSVIAQAQQGSVTAEQKQAALQSIFDQSKANIPAKAETESQKDDRIGQSMMGEAEKMIGSDKTVLAKPITGTISISSRNDLYFATASGFVRKNDVKGSPATINMSAPLFGKSFQVEFKANADLPSTISSDGKNLWMITPVGDNQSVQSDMELIRETGRYGFSSNALSTLQRIQKESIINESLKAFIDQYRPVYEAHGYTISTNDIEITDSRDPSRPEQCGTFQKMEGGADAPWSMSFQPYTMTITITPRAN